MPSIRQTSHGSILVRRGNSVRSSGCDALEDDHLSELSSIAQSDETSTEDGGTVDAEALLWDLNRDQERMRGFDDVANKLLLPEDTELMIQKFEKAEDIPFYRTYQLGKAVTRFPEETCRPIVGIVLLPGTVRLVDICLTPDLKVTSKDITSQVALSTLGRMKREARGKSYRSLSQDAVTIDGDNIEILHGFPEGPNKIDLFATLIEVNVSSLWKLMSDYKQIIMKSGAQMTMQQNKELLDRMIDAARTVCVKSPILFRMSTRRKIIQLNNTRYGVDSEHSFRAFTTSKGIQEIIMTSASYYSALDPSASGMDKVTQAAIRPRYLQMLTLLLSLLNDDDLQGMAEFLRRTYSLSPERPDMELLFLKVIPLTSINSKVFLQGLIPAVERWTLSDRALEDESEVWRSFIRRLATKGYLLPATAEQLGHERHSWVSGWPSDGIHSSTAFSRLQLHGETNSTFNEIPSARFSFEPDLKELTVILTDDMMCTINPKDFEQISSLTQGTYSVVTDEDHQICDLEITEHLLNLHINEAIRYVNGAIKMFNAQATPTTKSGRRLAVWKGRSNNPMVFPDLEPAARLTRNEAKLKNTTLAVAYKLGGRNVPKAAALRTMITCHNHVAHCFKRLCEAVGRDISYFEKHIQMVNKLLMRDRASREMENKLSTISDAPIAQTLGIDDIDVASKEIWYNHRVEVVRDPRYLHELLQVTSRAGWVTSVIRRREREQAEVRLADIPICFFVAPLHPVQAVYQDDEICVGDLVLLVGRYMVIAAPQVGMDGLKDYTGPCIMTNWLEIVEEHTETVTSRRGRNFQAREVLPTTTFI